MPTPRLLPPSLILCLIFLGVGTAYAQQKGSLIQQYQPGKTYLLKTVSTSETRTEPLESSPPATATTVQTFELKASKEGDQTLVKVSVVNLYSTISLDNHLQQQYDSTNPALSPPLLQQSFGAIKDKTFTMVYDAQHRFVKFADMPVDDQTPLGKQTAITTQQFAEAFRKQLDGFLPSTPLEADGTWTWEDRVVLPPLGDLQLKGKGTLEPIDANKFQPAKFEGTLEIAPSVAPDKTPLTISEAKFSGSLVFNPTFRQIIVLESTTNLIINSPERPAIHVKQTELTTLLSVTDTAP